MKKNIALFILAALSGALLWAQAPEPYKKISQLIHDAWQVKEGLPQNSVNAIIQTRDGYLWIGTYEGLVRFNGLSFTVFDRSTTPELQDGSIWIGTKKLPMNCSSASRRSGRISATSMKNSMSVPARKRF